MGWEAGIVFFFLRQLLRSLTEGNQMSSFTVDTSYWVTEASMSLVKIKFAESNTIWEWCPTCQMTLGSHTSPFADVVMCSLLFETSQMVWVNLYYENETQARHSRREPRLLRRDM